MIAALLAHHEIVLLAQGTASVGLAGWAAALGARWYSITNRRSHGRTTRPMRRDTKENAP